MTTSTPDKPSDAGLTAAGNTSVRNGRLILLLIAGIPVTMILAASWLWYFVVEGDIDVVGTLGTANQGALVQPPRDLAAFDATDDMGATLAFPVSNPKWTLLVPQAGETCSEACEERLYLTRQIHIAMGKEMNRIRRAFIAEAAMPEISLTVPALSDDKPVPEGFDAYLRREHPGLTAVTTTPAALQQLFPELADNPETWYLVDPAGWIMMSYSPEISYKDVISDLKFLLKNSNG
ncbi:MAG: hypothetical protein ABR612_00855 [Chromatocurvus sp.]